MKIESQVCSLVQAKRLKELGVKQDSYFWYSTYAYCLGKIKGEQFVKLDDSFQDEQDAFYYNQLETISAFTVAELGVMLPKDYISYKTQYEATGETCFLIYKVDGLRTQGKSREIGDTEAEARAAILIYLLETNLLTSEEINQRL